jgi:hypothetical protein
MKKMFLSRRQFVRTKATAVGALAIVPRHVVAGSRQISPDEKVNIAAIGIGSIGNEELEAVRSENIVRFCDVDQQHAVATMAAIKRGKHVYCEKPLAHSVYECRQLAKAAREHNVVSQLGNQGHSYESTRNFCEWIWDGAT